MVHRGIRDYPELFIVVNSLVPQWNKSHRPHLADEETEVQRMLSIFKWHRQDGRPIVRSLGVQENKHCTSVLSLLTPALPSKVEQHIGGERTRGEPGRPFFWLPNRDLKAKQPNMKPSSVPLSAGLFRQTITRAQKGGGGPWALLTDMAVWSKLVWRRKVV